ncbi:hypothetical protein DL766_000229 [Monosporascus sp. MC13-8B]|uniref:JmjC domain-containing protein n=1 Tax=Monosporascus cannonballus TaxID=155416 RepID=A0ABY0H9A3_9PEZI|nr:hypothetical protein DL762_005519 [Monosporascus cannonballus]RYO93103.1 hypothetical protein DL763_004499 [Monosporascus cannonballus]RYP39787.1 hypothetical protein DL766_000229 [Monosporascus sp. MC13-8B]
MASPPAPLTEAEKEFFLANGYIKLSNCFTQEQADDMTKGVWARLGMSPTDKGTWTQERVHMPSHRSFDAATFAPRAWAAICELCGGEDRVDPRSREWRDSLIVNLGTPETERRGPTPPKDLDEWHVDGDFFVHYLDSPDQALLVIPLFTDIAPGGGGTGKRFLELFLPIFFSLSAQIPKCRLSGDDRSRNMSHDPLLFTKLTRIGHLLTPDVVVLCPDAIPKVARHLYEHPEGVSPRMRTRSDPAFAEEGALEWYEEVVRGCDDGSFVEATGRVGDVYLLHPMMMHCAGSNALRNVRIITNPPVFLREPHRFDREDGRYSLVELKTMRGIGEENLRGWKITMPREKVVPERLRIQEAMRHEELKRMQELRNDVDVAA